MANGTTGGFAKAFPGFAQAAPWMGLGAAAGGLASLFPGKQGQPGGAQFVQAPQYSFTEPNLRLVSDFAAGNLQRLQAGQLPVFTQALGDIQRQQGLEQLHRRFFGGPGTFGQAVLPTQMATDVARGLGRGATAGRNIAGQLAKYGQLSSDIDKFIAQQQFGQATQAMATLPQTLMGIPQGPAGQFFQYGPTPYQPSFFEQAAQGIGGLLPFALMGL
jgi:hypothetical protein